MNYNLNYCKLAIIKAITIEMVMMLIEDVLTAFGLLSYIAFLFNAAVLIGIIYLLVKKMDVV